ncbi:murein biosynthesis integral membrane protein MurJ [Microbacterium sp. NPDC055357]
MSVGRASALIGAGTLVSRVTGLIRTIVLVTVLGAVFSRAGDAFAIANQLPNTIYEIISYGLLTAVIVPQIVRASAHADGGRTFISKLFTLGTVVLLVTSAVATLCAPLLVEFFAPGFAPDQKALATVLAYWCLPQIFFYGLYALVGEALNARKVYGPFTWAPIVNNVVSIAGFGLIGVVFGTELTAVSDWTPTMVTALGATATGGIVIQALVLLFFWRRTGLHLRPDFRWRGVGLGHIGRLAGWTFAMVVVRTLAGLVQTRVITEASGDGPSAFAMANAWLVFMLPYSIIVMSIGTPYFTRLSEHAHAGRDDDVRTDLSASIRVTGMLITIAAAALIAAAVPATRVFADSAGAAVAAAPVLVAYLVGLIPLSVLFVVQRAFYAYNDTRTPFVFTVIQCGLFVILVLVAQATLPLAQLAAGVALGQSISTLVQVVIATTLLRRRLGALGAGAWFVAYGRFLIAAVPAAAAGWLTFLLLGGDAGWAVADKLLGAVATALIGLVSFAVYVGVLALLRAPELRPALDLARRVIPRRR